MYPLIHQNIFSIPLNHTPQRIISLVPSQTEWLFDLGLGDRIIGITKFCVHPDDLIKTKEIIGGTKNINIEKIISLKPDLIIANKEENVKDQVEALQKYSPVYVSDVNNYEDACVMMLQIGLLNGRGMIAEAWLREMDDKFSKLLTQIEISSALNFKTAYLIWRKPYMAASGGTFISDMLKRCGLQNVFSHLTRYPEITVKDLQNSHCQLLLLSSEPYPFQQKHMQELQSHLPNTRILLVDGEMFSWYGSRLLQAPAYFMELIRQFS